MDMNLLNNLSSAYSLSNSFNANPLLFANDDFFNENNLKSIESLNSAIEYFSRQFVPQFQQRYLTLQFNRQLFAGLTMEQAQMLFAPALIQGCNSNGGCFNLKAIDTITEEAFQGKKEGRDNKQPLTSSVESLESAEVECKLKDSIEESKSIHSESLSQPSIGNEKDSCSIKSSASNYTMPQSPKSNSEQENCKHSIKFKTQKVTLQAPFFCQKYSCVNDYLNHQRKRLLKNNKYVFARPKPTRRRRRDDKEKASSSIKGEPDLEIERPKGINSGCYNSNKPRGSKFRGVSKNGNQWQVLIMVNKKKRYAGSYSSEEEAARAYDKVALQNHGVNAKTNFDYIEEEVNKIIAEPPLLKIPLRSLA